jgi:ankyrin repeat protein
MPSEAGSSALAPFLAELQRANSHDSVLPIINSLLPNSAFLEEPCAEGIAIELVEKIGSVQLFNLMAFIISNNFPGDSTSRNIYKWLKMHSPPFILTILSTAATPTSEALLDNLFRCAIEAGDVPVVKHLIRAGVSPNGRLHRHPSLPDDVTPLQFALCRGHTQLAQELIKAGSSIDEVGAGWKSSALVLAIIGKNVRNDRRFWSELDELSDDGSEDKVDMDIWSLFEPSLQNFALHGADNDHLFALIQSLMNAGAAINFDVVLQPNLLEQDLIPNNPFLEGHSLLTAASKYRHRQLVDLFLQRGAKIKYLTNREASALHECLYSWEEMNSEANFRCSLKPSSERESSKGCLSSDILFNLVGVARSLISAGAEVNDECGIGLSLYENCKCDNDLLHCTPLDLSVLTGSFELVEMMLSAGAYTTTKVSIEHSFRIGSLAFFRRLLIIGASVSAEAIETLMENKETWFYAIPLLEKRPKTRIKREIFHQAIRRGATFIIEHLLNTETFNIQALNYPTYNLSAAIEECCADGHVDTLRFLLTNLSTSIFSNTSWTGQAVELAITNDHNNILDILLSASSGNDAKVLSEKVLLAALRKNNTRMIKKLIGDYAGVSLTPKVEYGSYCSQCCERHQCNDVFVAAIELGDYQVINKLLDAGASLNTLGATGRIPGPKLCILPLTAAIIAKDSILVNHFVSVGASVNNPPKIAETTLTPLSAAVANRDLELVNLLIQHGSNPYDSIALAIATNDFRLLQTLLLELHNSKEPDKQDLGREALHNAIEKQNTVMVQAILGSPIGYMKSIQGLRDGLDHAVSFDSTPNLEIIGAFLGFIADLNHFSEGKFELNYYLGTIPTALCIAVIKKDLRKVELLLEGCGCLGERITKQLDPSAIYWVISGKNSDILHKLLEHGLDPNTAPVPRCGTPLEIAIERRNAEIVKTLLKHGANLNISFGKLSYTPLQVASKNGSREIVELLLEHGADVNVPPAKRHGATALQFAAMKGLLEVAFLLIENGADVNAPPAEVGGRTALEGAAEYGRLDMIQLLINAGASISQEGRAQYENALRRASENGHSAVRRLLESYHE